MTRKTTTIDLKGKAYAQVKDRIKEFRADCPKGLIETFPTISDSSIIFKARIIKDKSDISSAEATGHSFAKVTDKTIEKQFEKQETIAVGRALALLGYASDGDIASSEEMEEFLKDKQEKFLEQINETTEAIGNCETQEQLKDLWAGLSGELKNNKTVFDAKEVKKTELK